MRYIINIIAPNHFLEMYIDVLHDVCHIGLSHRRIHTRPVSFREAVVSCPNISSIACPKIKWFYPNITCLFCQKLAIKKLWGEVLQPPAPPPPRLVRIWFNWIHKFKFKFSVLIFRSKHKGLQSMFHNNIKTKVT